MDESQQLVQDDAQADSEWDLATQDFASDNDYDLDSKNEQEEDDDDTGGRVPADDEKNEDDEGDNARPDTNDEEPDVPKPSDLTKPSDDAQDGDEGENKGSEEQEPDTPKQEYSDPTRDARAVQRELKETEQAIKEDIRKEVFGDVPQELTDADGDPIRTISDVQRLQNPNTGQPFTEEEAAIWLMQAQRNLDTKLRETDQQVDEIAETNLNLKEESDAVLNKYGELLKSMPELQQQVWEQYERTLVKDEKTGIIQKAPVSLEAFYNTTLAPYVKLAQQLEDRAKSEEQQRQELEAEKARIAQEAERKQQRSDRQDIYSGGKSETVSAEDKEWAAVAKEYYES